MMDQAAMEGSTLGMPGMSGMESEKKIEAMEKELQILKGSIKKLMIDIRDQMNKSDNPFMNVQQLKAPATAQMQNNVNDIVEAETIEEDPMLSEPMLKEPMIKEPMLKEPMSMDMAFEPELIKPVVPEKKEIPVMEIPEIPEAHDMKMPSTPFRGVKVEAGMLGDIEEPLGMLEAMKERLSEDRCVSGTTDADRMDPQTIIRLMQWTRTVLMKNGSARFNDLLDAYVSMGYVTEDVKAIIMKMGRLVVPDAEPVPKDMNIKECVGDMYALFMILHPREKELDSRMLSIMLGYEDTNNNLL